MLTHREGDNKIANKGEIVRALLHDLLWQHIDATSTLKRYYSQNQYSVKERCGTPIAITSSNNRALKYSVKDVESLEKRVVQLEWSLR